MHKHILLFDDSFCLLCRSATAIEVEVEVEASGKHHQEPLSGVVCIINTDLVII